MKYASILELLLVHKIPVELLHNWLAQNERFTSIRHATSPKHILESIDANNYFKRMFASGATLILAGFVGLMFESLAAQVLCFGIGGGMLALAIISNSLPWNRLEKKFARDVDTLSTVLPKIQGHLSYDRYETEAKWAMGRAAAMILIARESIGQTSNLKAENFVLKDASRAFTQKHEILRRFGLIDPEHSVHFDFAEKHLNWRSMVPKKEAAAVPA